MSLSGGKEVLLRNSSTIIYHFIVNVVVDVFVANKVVFCSSLQWI